MKETETTQSEQATNMEAPLQFAYKQDAKINVTLEGWQFYQLQNLVKMFEGPIAVINNIHNHMINDGISKPVYMKDLTPEGNLRSDFFETKKYSGEKDAPTPKIEIVNS